MKTCYACGIDFNYNLYKINPKTEKPYTRCEPCRLARSIAEKKEYKKKKLENFKEFHISYDILHHLFIYVRRTVFNDVRRTCFAHINPIIIH